MAPGGMQGHWGSAAPLRPGAAAAATQARPKQSSLVRFRERGGLQDGSCSVAVCRAVLILKDSLDESHHLNHKVARVVSA